MRQLSSAVLLWEWRASECLASAPADTASVSKQLTKLSCEARRQCGHLSSLRSFSVDASVRVTNTVSVQDVWRYKTKDVTTRTALSGCQGEPIHFQLGPCSVGVLVDSIERLHRASADE